MADTPTLNDWLQARHNHWNTPASLINEYVRKATGSAIAQASRIVLGQDNEVYDVTTADYHQLIVRISSKENHYTLVYHMLRSVVFLLKIMKRKRSAHPNLKTVR